MRLADLPHLAQLAFFNEVRSRLLRTSAELRYERPGETTARQGQEAIITADLLSERGLEA